MYKPRSSQPHTEKDACHLCQSDTVVRPQETQILKDVWEGHETEGPQETQTYKKYMFIQK